MDALALRDQAGDLLLATVRDMDSAQTEGLRAAKAAGYPDGSPLTLRLNGASEEHAIGRLGVGFNLIQVVSEYRALRASVLEKWNASDPAPEDRIVDDLALFNGSIDQSLATAVRAYTRRVDESRDMFLAILGHDLRNPLGSIAMSAHLMPRTAALDPKLAGLATQISTSAQVMSQMISDLLDYTRTRLGAGMPVDRAAMDLGEVAENVVFEFRASHPKADLVLTRGGDLTGAWDAARLRQVLSNLIGNAIQHGDRHSPVEIVLSGSDREVSVEVRNQGNPIPAGEMTRIFDPLIRGARAAKPKKNRPGSIGLGLYIARELVLAHGGAIGVASSEEAGTVFTIHLPRHASTPNTELHPGADLNHHVDDRDGPPYKRVHT